MIFVRFFKLVILGAFLAPNFVVPPVAAHEQRAALTSILFNDRSGFIEIVHRFYIHDAEHAVRQVLGGDADILESEQSQTAFAAYVAQNFQLAAGDGKLVELNLLGFETEGRYFWVYQDIPIRSFETLYISHSALREIWPSQINTVNIEGRGPVKTLSFEGNADVLSVSF